MGYQDERKVRGTRHQNHRTADYAYLRAQEASAERTRGASTCESPVPTVSGKSRCVLSVCRFVVLTPLDMLTFSTEIGARDDGDDAGGDESP